MPTFHEIRETVEREEARRADLSPAELARENALRELIGRTDYLDILTPRNANFKIPKELYEQIRDEMRKVHVVVVTRHHR